MFCQAMAELANRNDKHEVVEELQPGCLAVALVCLGAQPGGSQ